MFWGQLCVYRLLYAQLSSRNRPRVYALVGRRARKLRTANEVAAVVRPQAPIVGRTLKQHASAWLINSQAEDRIAPEAKRSKRNGKSKEGRELQFRGSTKGRALIKSDQNRRAGGREADKGVQ
jgi:hypothetical protein